MSHISVYSIHSSCVSSMAFHRNQSHQEQLWEISCNLLKDYLSPDIWSEYGSKETEYQTEEHTVHTEEVQEQGRRGVAINGTAEELQEPPTNITDQKMATELPLQSDSAATSNPH